MEGADRILLDIGPMMADGSASRVTRESLSMNAIEAVTDQLITRLARSLPDQEHHHGLSKPSDDEIDALCDALIASDSTLALDFSARLQRRNVSPDLLCLGYIAKAAQCLGARWVEDRSSFLEVTLGLARLHAMLRNLDRDLLAPPNRATHGYRALFSAVPGETHMLGITMAAGFFRRAGWGVDLNASDQLEALLSRARSGPYELIGLSVGSDAGSLLLEETVQQLRAAQPNAVICLGGHLTESAPRLAEQTGVDLIMQDITTAPFFLQKMVANALSH